MYRFIPPLIALVPQDSNATLLRASRAVASMRQDEAMPRLDFALVSKKRLIEKIIPGKNWIG